MNNNNPTVRNFKKCIGRGVKITSSNLDESLDLLETFPDPVAYDELKSFFKKKSSASYFDSVDTQVNAIKECDSRKLDYEIGS